MGVEQEVGGWGTGGSAGRRQAGCCAQRPVQCPHRRMRVGRGQVEGLPVGATWLPPGLTHIASASS